MATGTILLGVPPQGYDGTNPPGEVVVNGRTQIALDAATDEPWFWVLRMPQDYASGPVLKLQFASASATTGDVIVQAELFAVTPNDSAAVSSDSYDTANASAATTVPATTAGRLFEISITLTNADSLAAGDYLAIRASRDANNGSDTMAGDLYLLAASLEYTTT